MQERTAEKLGVRDPSGFRTVLWLLYVRVTVASAESGGGSPTWGSLWYQGGVDFGLPGLLWSVCFLWGVELVVSFWALGAALRRPEPELQWYV